MRYTITKRFVAGPLDGLTITEDVPVAFEVGRRYTPCVGTSAYVVEACRPVDEPGPEAPAPKSIAGILLREFDNAAQALRAAERLADHCHGPMAMEYEQAASALRVFIAGQAEAREVA